MTDNDKNFMRRAIELARQGVDAGNGGPFGAVVVKDGVIVGEGFNQVTANNDPTAHAEVTAIRDACRNLNSFQLDGCVIYTSCEPCPMCFGAIYWARPDKLFIACSRDDAADAGFDDAFIYDEIEKPQHERQIAVQNILRDEAMQIFEDWKNKTERIEY